MPIANAFRASVWNSGFEDIRRYATYDLAPANEIQRKGCFGATRRVQAAFLLIGQANFLNEFFEAFVRAEWVEHRHRLEINDMLGVFCVDLLQ